MRGWKKLFLVVSILFAAELTPAHAQRRVVGTFAGTVVEIDDLEGTPPAVTLGMPVTGSLFYGISPIDSAGAIDSYNFLFGPGAMRCELSAGAFSWDVETIAGSGSGTVLLNYDESLHRIFATTYVSGDDFNAFSGAFDIEWCNVINMIRVIVLDDAAPGSLLKGLYLPTGPSDVDLSAATSVQVEISSKCSLYDLRWKIVVDIDQLTLVGPELVETYCVGAPNSVGPGATINVRGSFGVSDQDLTLLATGCVPHEFGAFFYGSTSDATPFGAGSLCVGGELFRIPSAALADAAGDVERKINWNLPPLRSGAGMITPGSTWHFQYWYRDPGHGFNLSNAMRVVFFP